MMTVKDLKLKLLEYSDSAIVMIETDYGAAGYHIEKFSESDDKGQAFCLIRIKATTIDWTTLDDE